MVASMSFARGMRANQAMPLLKGLQTILAGLDPAQLS
jgi:hypothetical protein